MKNGRNCAHCDTFVELPAWRLAKTTRSFCGQDCKAAWQRGREALERRRRVDLICEYCGQGYELPQSKAERSRFCSRRCQATAIARYGEDNPASNSVALPCDWCGATIRQPASQAALSTRHFCGQSCKAAWQSHHQRGERNPAYSSAPVSCEMCGAIVTKAASRRARNLYHFCTHACYGEWRKGRFSGPDSPLWIGGRNYYGPNWREQRRRARERDNYTCQRCGVAEEALGRELDVHHIQPFRTFGYVAKGPDANEHYQQANRLDNLLSLCAMCHLQVEHGNASLSLG